MKTFSKLLKNELKLSIRGMDMIIFALFMPIVVLVILGITYGNQPVNEEVSFTWIQQSFGALSTISICAGGVMGLPLVISDYREKKILKRYQVTPISPAIILVVHVTIYAIYSMTSLILLLLIARLFFNFHMYGSWLTFIGGYLLVMVSMFSIGMMVGGISPNSKIASVIASLLYFPMLIFSGATLPYEVMPEVLQKIVNVLPLTQGIKLLKKATVGSSIEEGMLALIVMVGIAIVCTFISIKYFRWE